MTILENKITRPTVGLSECLYHGLDDRLQSSAMKHVKAIFLWLLRLDSPEHALCDTGV